MELAVKLDGLRYIDVGRGS
jgi:hypothetical protein